MCNFSAGIRVRLRSCLRTSQCCTLGMIPHTSARWCGTFTTGKNPAILLSSPRWSDLEFFLSRILSSEKRLSFGLQNELRRRIALDAVVCRMGTEKCHCQYKPSDAAVSCRHPPRKAGRKEKTENARMENELTAAKMASAFKNFRSQDGWEEIARVNWSLKWGLCSDSHRYCQRIDRSWCKRFLALLLLKLLLVIRFCPATREEN